MLKKRISEKAKRDIAEIRRFTLQSWGKEQTLSYVGEMRQKIDLLAERPQIGVDRSRELGDGIHCFLTGSHAIYYSYDSEVLTVWSVLHQKMLPQKHLAID